ncbi:hypothetical protein I302_101296 [Kwoniella bestiolae CBS 10118]|uniref:2-dehydropantoate 2-reductase n=1 Tax=Kwoniella bestiolae CBS 10118 TaxID=1296100 RepID=A0A1B9G7H4_9TREE|nr:hypothetical protein I302_04670 [Kwoniella bestiolae CBS 10118]OCF26978.1 hypothetical protein I302_04670 [Kwoniella bestiolae CBS 10118]
MTRTRIHILGIGSIGTLIAHHLHLSTPSTPLTLLVRSPGTFPKTLSSNRQTTRTISEAYQVESSLNDPSSNEYISSLLICTKTTQTSQAIEPLLHRLDEHSVISLLQNGMGVYQELISTFFRDRDKRPHFILGTTPHAVSPAGRRGGINHHIEPGGGFIKWGLVPDPTKNVGHDRVEVWICGKSRVRDISVDDIEGLEIPDGRQDLIHLKDTLSALLSLTDLKSQLLSYNQLNQALLLKLVINAAVNPITAILGRGQMPNGRLQDIPWGVNIVDRIIEESSQILLEQLKQDQNQNSDKDMLKVFGAESLKKIVYDTIESTKHNTSSMAVDIREKRRTEIDYINGYLVKLGDELGCKTDLNRLICEMIKFIEEEQKLIG